MELSLPFSFQGHFGGNLGPKKLQAATRASLIQAGSSGACNFPGANCKHHLSHTDSVRLRLLLKIGFEQFWDAQGSPKTPQTTPGEGRDPYKNLFD